MKLVNLTPHAINIVLPSSTILTIAPSGTIARVATRVTETDPINDIPIVITHFNDVVGIPEKEPGTMYIVSRMVVEVAGRVDLLCPGELVRDEEGRVIGCKNLSR